MGGIVTRRFLVKEQSFLIQRGLNKIGLFLVASPSLGSEYANWLGALSSLMGHTQAEALNFSQGNVWLNDLDKDFVRLLENNNLQIRGKELIEDLPLYGKGLLRQQIVQPFSGARYFSDSFKVPKSDHITIATPDSGDAIQHRLLVHFMNEFSVSNETIGRDNPESPISTLPLDITFNDFVFKVRLDTRIYGTHHRLGAYSNHHMNLVNRNFASDSQVNRYAEGLTDSIIRKLNYNRILPARLSQELDISYQNNINRLQIFIPYTYKLNSSTTLICKCIKYSDDRRQWTELRGQYDPELEADQLMGKVGCEINCYAVLLDSNGRDDHNMRLDRE